MNHEYFADGLPDLDGPNQGISFDADTIAQALVNIYQKKYGNGTAPEPTLFEKTKEIFSNAINKGWNAGGSPTTDRNTAFIDALRHNTEVFSAFRTHKMQSDIAAQLLNDKGELKPFSKFLKDVKPYVSHQNRAWLQTEYDTAVLRAHQAADWKQFEVEKDVLPNLEWQPSTSSNPGEDHKPYWFTVLPIEHEFWKKHRPGDRWNCKCRLTNTDKAPTAAPAETFVKDLQPSKGLESNPGTTGEIFSDKHPYFPENCGKCPFNKGVGKLFANLVGKKGNCFKCDKTDEICGKSYKGRWSDIENDKNYKPVKGEKNIYAPEGRSSENDFIDKLITARVAVNYGYRVWILGKTGKRNPDFLFERKGIYHPYDLKRVQSINSLEQDLIKSQGQTNRVLIKINRTGNPRIIINSIRKYFEQVPEAQEVLIFQGKRPISINRNFFKQRDYVKRFMNIWI